MAKKAQPEESDRVKEIKAEEEANERNHAISAEEEMKLVGDLAPGEEGWLPIDEYGKPTGPAQKGTPPEGTRAARVMGVPPVNKPVALQTPSGAHVTNQMEESNFGGELAQRDELGDSTGNTRGTEVPRTSRGE